MRVVNLSFGHQRDRFYAPFQEAFNATSESLTGEDGGKPGLLKRLANFFASPEEWISWKGGVVSFTLLCLGATFVWAGRPTLVGLRGYPAWELITRLGAPHQAEPDLLDWMYGTTPHM